ncbi:hypothetical protein QCA50_004000 [Cerrena zonata]|uniref:DNA topoisomerase I n=1 Tax=Cerrena zonata TaxID=2478898 RepID=A0AAW0GMS6_9APHY
MSADISMSSDDDQPLAPRPGPSKPNGRLVTNGKTNGKVDSDSAMSEDDDIPLSQSTRTKSEPATPQISSRKRKQAPVYSSSSDEDTPLASTPLKGAKSKSAAVPLPGALQATTVPAAAVNGNGRAKKAAKKEESDYEQETPQPKKRATKTQRQPPKKRTKKGEVELESEDDEPIAVKSGVKKRNVKKEEVAESSEDEKPLKKAKKPPAKRAKKEEVDDESSNSKPKKGKAKKEENGDAPVKKGRKKKEEEEEEVFRWWENQDDADGSIKWNTLEHNGVYFPPAYEPLPKNVKMKYDGKSVDLPPESEEVAGFYGAMIETEHAKDAVFNKNFFTDFLDVLKQHPPRDGTKIKEFARCDFRPMFDHFEAEKEKKKALTTAQKKELKTERDKLEGPFTHCSLDGRKEKVGNFRVEPPGLFRGRGEHPKKGALKIRVRPEDVTINIGEGVPIPKPNVPGKWKKVIHDQTVTWLATWTENVNGNHKYVFLAAGSSIKGQSDMMKFEKARELKKHVDVIRKDYTADLKTKVMKDRQRATAMYFIDRLALRAGNEKGEDEADTVGCCSLRCEHVTLEPPNYLIFDFLGKDSIRYYNKVAVEDQVFKNIKLFKENKNDDDDLFDRVDTAPLNRHLASYMKGLTAKVFRTYNASITFQEQLDQGTPEKGSVVDKLKAYNHANRMVAILCNHQRAVPKTHEQSMGKMREKLRGLKYDRMKLRHALFTIDAKFKKNKKYNEDESDLDDEGIVEHEELTKVKEIEKAEKKFQKDNEKLAADGKSPQPESVLKERKDEIEAEFKKLKKERGTKKHEMKRERPTEKIEEAIEKIDDKIRTFKFQMEDREAGKEVALGTSKINYLDPRITAAWCKKHDVPIEKLFSKTLLTKFPWAMEVDEHWKF